ELEVENSECPPTSDFGATSPPGTARPASPGLGAAGEEDEHDRYGVISPPPSDFGAASQSWRARHSGDSLESSQGLATRASPNLDSRSGRFSGAANSSMASIASTNSLGNFS